jgi:hypothetical protein
MQKNNEIIIKLEEKTIRMEMEDKINHKNE